MSWVGRWKNQYGSILTITDDAEGRIIGTFKTALLESGFYGTEIAVSGIHLGHCINFAFTASTAGGDLLCSYSGLSRGGRLNTVWHVISDGQLDPDARITERLWPHAVTTNADIFMREA
ncbi:hypothetical protein FZC33_03320 [Labrys sp. KNU-23]|uniref:avidin/streptavidin family protein n=1 Tax=Labrys sp. KNU-23 TaxID=2789216 RepID=UPI0011EFED07|nr:avidin/streptavidin family protein [Labrys sp. KNU-23]QEN85291.1 hypothetical protein FZC33_03320 [Labrys sp. KNU-23]